ncbi:MAG: transposase [Myxococcales bacterium]|nr:transposase [Myxococcales bacterium]
MQRVNSDLRLSPHLHSLFLDGVFTEDEGGELVFHPLPFLTNDDVGGILQIVRARVLALLRRKGVIEDDAVARDAKLADSEPALAALAAASVTGTLPAGPALRRRDPIQLRCEAELHTKALCATEGGFSLHAATTARAGDAAGREALCAPSGITKRVKYILRPPIANERVQLLGDDLVRLVLKRPFSDGTFALDLDPLALLVRLATTVPPPGFHTVRYAGVLAAASKWESPSRSPSAVAGTLGACRRRPELHDELRDLQPEGEGQAGHPSFGISPLAELLMRAFKIDVERCDNCGGRMKLRHLVMATASIERYLAWLGEPSDPPRLAPARGPPYFKHPAIRRRLARPWRACSGGAVRRALTRARGRRPPSTAPTRGPAPELRFERSTQRPLGPSTTPAGAFLATTSPSLAPRCLRAPSIEGASELAHRRAKKQCFFVLPTKRAFASTATHTRERRP